MLRPSLLAAFGLAVSSLVFPSAPAVSAGVAPAQQPCEDTLPMTPVVTFVSAGSTLLGPEFQQMTVFSSGLVLVSGARSHFDEEYARMVQVPQEAVLELARELVLLGGSTLCDQEANVADLPLKTVSIASGMGSDVRLHSFSYWLPTDQFGLVESAIEGWALDHGIVEVVPE